MGRNERMFLGILLDAILAAKDEIEALVKKSPTPLDDIALDIFFAAIEYVLTRLETAEAQGDKQK